MFFFPKNSRKFSTSLSPAIGCTKNEQPIGVTVHSHFVESDVGEGGVAVNFEKNKILPEYPVAR